MVKNKMNKLRSALLAVAVMIMVFTTLLSVLGLTDTTRPTIISVSPINNEKNDLRNEQVVVEFSEEMDSSTINENTFLVMQRTTPSVGVYRLSEIEGSIVYNGKTATFSSDVLLAPNQEFGNVFTATITPGAKDLAGNSISRDYVWSFTTGLDPFNTGSSTSKTDQSGSQMFVPAEIATPIVESIQLPAQTITPQALPQTTASVFPWVWVIGGILLLIALLVALNTRSANQKGILTKKSPFGDVHPVIEIEGIGQEYNEKLQAIGIKNTKQLWESDAKEVAQRIGAPIGSFKSWQHMSELASVKDIGPQYAELLERSGIHSINQLKMSNPDKLLKIIQKKQDSLKINIQGNTLGHATIKHWIDVARYH